MAFFAPGELIVRREINWGHPVIAWPVYVVRDDDELLVTFTPTGAPFAYSSAPYSPFATHHPWWPQERWRDHGVLMCQRPGDRYAVWHFWEGPERRFSRYYLNLQDDVRRTSIGYDTEDHELDVVHHADGVVEVKDEEAFELLATQGRYHPLRAEGIRHQGRELVALASSGTPWWMSAWTQWTPPTAWRDPPPVGAGWESVPFRSE